MRVSSSIFHLLATVAAGLMALDAIGQTGPPQIIHRTYMEPDRTVVGDLDGDALPDVVMASQDPWSTSVGLAWSKNLGGGEFGPEKVISEEESLLSALVLSDLDMDGDPDIVCAKLYGDIIWLANDGTGVFGPIQVISQQSSFEGVNITVSDLNGDTYPDIAYAAESPGTAGFHLNDGSGGFVAATVLAPETLGADQVTAGDLDGDGDQDLLISGSATVVWYENIGTGSFTSIHTVYSGAWEHEVTLIADLDGDLDMDIVAGTTGSSWSAKRLIYYLNAGGGVFGSATLVQSSLMITDFQGMLDVMDMDGDQDLDLLVKAEVGIDETRVVNWYANQGNGTFGTSAEYSLAGPYYVSIADTDVDGDPDLVVTRCDRKVETWSNDGLGSFTFDEVVLYTYDSASSVGVDDLDGDGDPDVVFENDGLVLAENFGGIFDTTHYFISGPGCLNDPGINFVLEDLDADGLMDIVFGSYVSGQLGWVRNLGDGAFTPIVQLGYASNVSQLLLADVDGDSDRDILVRPNYPSTERIRWYRNDGSGTITTPPHPYITDPMPATMKAIISDVDVDGDPDVVRVGTENSLISWHENSTAYGSPNLPPSHTISTGSAYVPTAIMADLDIDGADDLAYVRSATGELVWMQNNGAGAFAAEQVLCTPASEVSRIRALDMDMDGSPDLLMQLSFEIAWSRNLGGGLFDAPVVLVDSATSTMDMATGDMDGDGDQDLIYDWRAFRSPLVWSSNELPITLSTTALTEPRAATLHCDPVPFSDYTIMRSDPAFLDGTRIELRDGTGRLLRTQATNGNHSVVIPRSGLKSGVYTLTATGPNEAPRMVRVVVQ